MLAASIAVLWSCAGVRTDTPASATPVADVPPVVTITARGASPQVLHIFSRDVATFVNGDDGPHEIRSDPRQNSDARCATVGVGLLLPGERRRTDLQPSGVPCFYRDERDPDNPALQGYVLAHY